LRFNIRDTFDDSSRGERMRAQTRGAWSAAAGLRSWRVNAALLALALGVFANGPGSAAFAAASPQAPVGVAVASAQIGRPIAPSFLGLALEFRSVPSFIGRNPRDPDTVFAQLIRNLTPGQRPVLRIGGESTDRTWWPVPHMHRPYGITNDLTPAWITSARTLADATNGQLTIGINLEANRLKITQTEADELVAGIGRKRIAALELGNEPELYAVVPWYELDHGVIVPWYLKRHGVPVLARRSGYDFKTFSGEFARFRKLLPKLPLAAPSTGNPQWLSQLPQLLAAQSLSSVTFHRYGLNGCVIDRSNPSYPTIPNLLSAYASRGIMTGVEPTVALAHSRGMSFRIDEMNSVTCGGRIGVSNTFASALWVLDALFEMASDGVDGVNIHTFPGSANGLFDVQQTGDHWQGTVHPEYYGLLMFAQAAPAGARLLRISAPSGGDVRSWATRAPDGTIRVVLINDSLTSAHSVRVRVPGRGTATVSRLQAATAAAVDGVTLGGQSFATQTQTGLLAGPPQTSAVTASQGVYSVAIPASSAALLSWKTG
jgi:hypothetical protein